MTDSSTPRLGLPLLAAGQAGKELTHNEALSLLDLLVQGAVQSAGTVAPPAAPLVGQCWIVGSGATGAWAGQAGRLAGWTAGGWRFVDPADGMEVWDVSRAIPIAYRGGVWHEGNVVARRVTIAGQQVVGGREPAIADPSGGGVTDDMARTAVVAILGALRRHGLIAPS